MQGHLTIAELDRGFRLGRWHVQPAGGVLRRLWPAVTRRRVEPKVMQVLLELATRPRQFVSKDELFSAVWGRRPSSDDCLTRAVHALRQALDDDPRQPRYIETRNNVGYRLIAPVRPARRIRRDAAAVVLAVAVLVCVAIVGRPDLSRSITVPPTAGLSDAAQAQFLQARYWLAQGTAASLQSALTTFADLAAAEPDFAPAWLGQAQAGLELFKQGRADVEQLQRSRAAAEQAMRLAGPSSALAICLGQTRLFLDWDLAGAEDLYRDAIRMDPREPVARIRYAWLLVARGDFGAASGQIEHVRLLDPLYYASEDMAALLLYAGQVDAAVAELERLERTTRLQPAVLRIMGTAYWARGDHDAARNAFIQMWDALRALSATDRASLAAAEPEGLIRRILAEGLAQTLVAKAGFHALLGERDAALSALELAASRRVPQVLYAGAMPEFVALRNEPRFRQLLAELGLEPRASGFVVDPHISPSSFSQFQVLSRNPGSESGSD
jgi:DNA-binding winged helix-turn-helix (wHTH) protein/Flp pilus assembly protein TadD